jgi:DNA repair protein RecO (recombination protein O)
VLRLFGEGEPNAAAYNLLCHELRLLDAAPAAAGAANLLAFRLKLLLAAGFVPELSACAACGGDPTETFFSAAAGGVLCGECVAGDCFALEPAALAFMVEALALPLKDTSAAARATLAQVERAVSGTVEYHAHVRLRSVA